MRKTTKWLFQQQNENKQDLRVILIEAETILKIARQGSCGSEVTAGIESNIANLQTDKVREYVHQLGKEDSKFKRSWGFPLNTTFKSIDDLWNMVKQTGMHAVNR